MSRPVSACAVVAAVLDDAKLAALIEIVKANGKSGSMAQLPCHCIPHCSTKLDESTKARERHVETAIFNAWEEGRSSRS